MARSISSSIENRMVRSARIFCNNCAGVHAAPGGARTHARVLAARLEPTGVLLRVQKRLSGSWKVGVPTCDLSREKKREIDRQGYIAAALLKDRFGSTFFLSGAPRRFFPFNRSQRHTRSRPRDSFFCAEVAGYERGRIDKACFPRRSRHRRENSGSIGKERPEDVIVTTDITCYRVYVNGAYREGILLPRGGLARIYQ